MLNKRKLELYQVPVVSVKDLAYGTYTIHIFVNAAYDYDDDDPENGDCLGGVLDRGGEFFFDTVRIYNPIDTKSADTDSAYAYALYQSHGEADPGFSEVRNILIDVSKADSSETMNGVVYLETKSDGTSSIAEYISVGPNNETYLSEGNAIAFKVEAVGGIPASLDIGAKSADGRQVVLSAVTSTEPPEVLSATGGRTISTCTTQYYPIEVAQWAPDETTGKYYTYVIIRNNGSGILSITNIKNAYDTPAASVIGDETVESYTAERVTRGASSGRYVNFVVDEKLAQALPTVCTEHEFAYADNGGNHTAKCTKCGAEEIQPHEYTDGECICGAVEVTEPQPDENLKFTMNISVGAAMSVSYNVMASAASKYADFYLEVSKANADGEPTVVTYGLSEGHEPMTNMMNIIYSATYEGISAKQMGDEFSTTLYAIDENGNLYYGETVTESIKGYLVKKASEEKATDEFKTMAVDMLKYGAEAQNIFNYGTDDLVTADLSEDLLSYATVAIPEATDISASNGDGVAITANVTVGSKVELGLSIFKAGLASPETVRCEIRDAEGNLIAEPAVANAMNMMFSAGYSEVGAREMRKPITATFYMGDEAISQTVTWSVESYVAQVRANENSTENDIAMVNAMLAYGDSVGAYLTSIGQ